ncbi:pyridoxal-phosphate dependent enzyme [Streptomyces sp. SB3404]|uniref:Pyridoxal-phosphate dependent enzyme n=1 Tax=Streptomyces boncukensis TaxID=2711219 RepID=A0A6G4X6Z3_9ACTN|nr:pyridoxal-phosphate dependent enzyme [Streptomyces boncukensis]
MPSRTTGTDADADADAATASATATATADPRSGAVPPTLADIRAAGAVLDGVVRTTPMTHSRHLSGLVGCPVHLKCENLQRTGSFKLRGGYARLAALSPRQRAAGVVAASAGNHAQGVALAAALLGVRATVFMPEGAPAGKAAATRRHGAEVRTAGRVVDEALAAAQDHARRTGAVLIHPFDHPDVIAGQGTVGLEILAQLPWTATVVVAVGGGGLAAGVATAVKALRPQTRVIGVQAENAAPYPPSLASGRPTAVRAGTTIADGIKVARPGELPFRIVKDLVDEVRTVGEDALRSAQHLCLERAKLLVEPAGAAPVAALLAAPESFTGPLVAVLSGGNADLAELGRTLGAC